MSAPPHKINPHFTVTYVLQFFLQKKDKINSEEFQTESNVNKNKTTKSKSNAQKAMPFMIVVIITLANEYIAL